MTASRTIAPERVGRRHLADFGPGEQVANFGDVVDGEDEAAGEILEDPGGAREVGARERLSAVVRLGAPIGQVEVEQGAGAVVAGEELDARGQERAGANPRKWMML